MTFRPWINRRFGVELEMMGSTTDRRDLSYRQLQDAVRRGLTTAGESPSLLSDRDAGYYHSNGETWDVKTDSSCAWEVASRAMTMDGEAQCAELAGVMTELAALNPVVNRQCGLHVHVEVTDYDWQALRSLMILYARYEPFFFSLCPTSRTTNGYCSPTRKATWNGEDGPRWTQVEAMFRAAHTEPAFRRALDSMEIRGALNTANFFRGRRIEFRLGGGTMQYEKVRRWVQLLLTLVQRAKIGSTDRNDRIAAGVTTDPQMPALPRVSPGGWSDKPLSVGFVAKVLGLSATANLPGTEIPAESAALIQWIETRQRDVARRARRGEATEG